MTFVDQSIDVLDPNLARISKLQRASWHKPTGGNAEYDRFKKRLIPRVERAVDRYASAGGRRHFRFNCVEQLAGQVCSRWPEFFPCSGQDELASTRPIS